MSDPTSSLLAAARFAHFAAVCVLFGLAAFPFYAWADDARRPSLSRALRWSAWAGFATAVLAAPAIAANMGGDLSSAFDAQTLIAATTDTTLGKVWAARAALALLVAVAAARSSAASSKLMLGAAGLLLGSVAMTGHSGLPGGGLGLLHHLVDAVHLLAAGWWIGGLLALALTARGPAPSTRRVLERFSGVGYWAVAAILLSGVVKSALLIGSIKGAGTAYGLVLLAKVVLVADMGALAMINRCWITPGLARGDGEAVWLSRLQRSVRVEFALGLTVLAVAGVLGTMPPPISA